MSVYDDMGYDINIFTIDDNRKDLRRVVDYFQSLPYHERAVRAFLIETRNLPEKAIEQLDGFYVDEDARAEDFPEWLQLESLGMVKYGRPVFYGRFVFPVKTPKGEVMGFIGWDPNVKPKYLDSYNYGYKAKATTFFGMENIGEYYTSKEPVFITEGLMCTAWLRANGFQAMASLGSTLSKYCQTILKRFGYRCVMVPDNDEAGEKYLMQARYCLPQAQKIMVKVGKDIDGCRKEHEQELLEDLRNIMNPNYKFKIILRR